MEAESLEQAVARIKSQLAENEALVSAKDRLRREQQRLGELGQQERSTEWGLDDRSSKVAAAEKELYSGRIANPKELANLQRDIDSLKLRRSQLEDEALGVMEDGRPGRTFA